jgi:hypothetical protein
MTVYAKLTKARLKLSQTTIKKGGENKFAKYKYFELADFLPAIHEIFDEIGLCGVFSFEGPNATLTIHDTEEAGSIAFLSPVVSAQSAKGQSIQDLGSTHTYLRRYLWLMAMEITEHDTVDGGDDKPDPKSDTKLDPKSDTKPDSKPDPKPEVKKVAKEEEFKQDYPMLVDMMFEWANVATNIPELTKLWKGNQVAIDEMKENHKELYTKLTEHFAMLRKNFEEKNG